MKVQAWNRIIWVLGMLAIAAGRAQGQHMHRNGFEAPKAAWTPGPFDAVNEVVAHTNTDQGAHNGQRSEYLQLKAQNGKTIYYQYAVGKAPISDELNGGIWLKANRPGLQLVARIILPNERDGKNLDLPMSTLIHGDTYQNTGRWQRISFGRPMQLAKQQQQLLQAQLKRQVNFNDAYIDALLLNVYAGPGPVELWIDDLEIGPVLNEAAPASPTPRAVPVARTPQSSNPSKSPVDFNGTHLLVGGRPFFMRGIRCTDTPVDVLAKAGFNTIFVDAKTDPAVMKQAADLGLWVVPMLPILGDDAKYNTAEGLSAEVQKLSETDGILFWHLGKTLAFEQVGQVQRAAQIIRQADPGRPLGADVWDGLQQYSRTINLTAIHRWPLMTTMELPKYREWLDMRRRLMMPGAFSWTWIQTHIPDWNSQLLYGQAQPKSFDFPVGPQPEQIRLLVYSAIAAGNKGIAFWSDRFLADSHQGRDRLLECALINQELEMIEPLLAGVDEPPQWIDTSSPDVKAAVMRTSKGILVLPMWQGKGAQFVPGQAAVSRLSFVVPQVPGSMAAWEVLPGDVRALKIERVVGGVQVTIPEFGLTSSVVFTSDTNMVIRFQEGSRSRRQQAAKYTYDLASYSLEKMLKIEGELEQMGHALSDSASLTKDAQNRLNAAEKQWNIRLFTETYRESQRALRPGRILMKAQWDKAVKELDTPVASPYALSFYTLPKHWQLMNDVKAATFGPNLLPGGDFEDPADGSPPPPWKLEEPTLDEVEQIAIRATDVDRPVAGKGDETPSALEKPKQGSKCALLQIRPKNRVAPPAVLERTLVSLQSPPVKLEPGTLVRVSAWVRIPQPITASPDGALFYESSAGEPLAVRLTETTAWKKYTLYRRVPPSGQISVTLALTGIGTVYFDDVRVEPASGSAAPGDSVVANPKQ
jgi:hypothetical protein